jgi:hypothetical protein
VTEARLEPPEYGVRSLGKALSAVVAPTSLVSGLLYYFGWAHAYWFYDYFGVDSTVLGFGTVDYLMRSMDTLFVPMTLTATAALAVLWGHSLLRARLDAGARPAVLRVLVPGLAAAGLLLILAGLWSMVAATFLRAYLAAAPLCLALGVMALVYVLRLRRLLSPAPPAVVPMLEWAVVFVIVGLSLFWAATDYAYAVGRGRARELVRELPTYPPVTVYSARSLSLDVPGITETRCREPQAAFQVRYDGFRLLPRSGNQYLLLPAHWEPATGVAVILPRTDAVRLEFAPRVAARPPAC